MLQQEVDLKLRTKQFALQVVKFVESLPSSKSLDIFSRQLLRSATSVAANYRAARRARSKADFINKLGIVEEEVDESHFWLEMMQESGLVSQESCKELLSEADELILLPI